MSRPRLNSRRTAVPKRHPSQKVQELADGGLQLTLQLSSLHEIEPWVLSWGEHARVLGPAELKKRFATRLKAALA